MPTVDDLRSIIVGCEATATGGACKATADCGPTQDDCLNPDCKGCDPVAWGYTSELFDERSSHYWSDTPAPWLTGDVFTVSYGGAMVTTVSPYNILGFERQDYSRYVR